MTRAAPPWLAHGTGLDDADRYAAMTPEQRLDAFVDVCELARTILEDRLDRAHVLAASEPMPATADATWRRLVRDARGRAAS